MKVRKHKDYFEYNEDDYSLQVYPQEGNLYLKHKCPTSTPGDNCYDYILSGELEKGVCRYCGDLDIPESLQALYYLYEYGK